MPAIACPCCRRKLRVPDHLAGRRVTCPRCNQAVAAPAAQSSAQSSLWRGLVEDALSQESAPSQPTPPSPDVEALPTPARLGIAALVLGTVSILVLCVPFVGYASIALSGVGLLLGIGGLFSAWASDDRTLGHPLAGGAGVARRFGTRARDYPLAGAAVSLLALVLALLPLLFR